MDFIWATTVKDLKRKLRDPFALLVWAVIPYLIAGVLQLAFGGDDTTLTAKLMVVDQDDSFGSRFLVGAFDQGELGEMIDTESVELDEGRDRIAHGDGSALLVIPAGFGRAILDGQPISLELVTNPAQRILPALIEETLVTLADGLFYIERGFGSEVRRVRGLIDDEAEAVPDSVVTATSLTINNAMNRLAPYAFPPVIDLRTPESAADDEGMNFDDFGRLFLLGMVFMAIMFVGQSLAEDVWREKQLGTLARGLTTPRRVLSHLTGKLLAAAILIAGLVAIGLLGGRFVFGMELSNLGSGVAWATLFGVLMVVILMIAQMLASNQRAGSVLSSVVIFPLALLGGSFFPLEVMPEFLSRIGRFTPNGWALGHWKGILMRDTPWMETMLAAALLLATIIALTGVAAWLVRARFIRS